MRKSIALSKDNRPQARPSVALSKDDEFWSSPQLVKHAHMEILDRAKRPDTGMVLLEGLVPSGDVPKIFGVSSNVLVEAVREKKIEVINITDTHPHLKCYRFEDLAGVFAFHKKVQGLDEKQFARILPMIEGIAGESTASESGRQAVAAALASATILCVRRTIPEKREEFLFEILPGLVGALRETFLGKFPAALFALGALKQPEKTGDNIAFPIPRRESWPLILREAKEVCSSLEKVAKIDMVYVLSEVYNYEPTESMPRERQQSKYLSPIMLAKDYLSVAGMGMLVRVSAEFPFSVHYFANGRQVDFQSISQILQFSSPAESELSNVNLIVPGVRPRISDFTEDMGSRLSEHTHRDRIDEPRMGKIGRADSGFASEVYVRRLLSEANAMIAHAMARV